MTTRLSDAVRALTAQIEPDEPSPELGNCRCGAVIFWYRGRDGQYKCLHRVNGTPGRCRHSGETIAVGATLEGVKKETQQWLERERGGS
jgi:hypothetical protein